MKARYYSTRRESSPVTLKDAVLRGLAPDNGLYLPNEIPLISTTWLKNISEYTFPQIALEVAKTLFQEDLPLDVLRGIVEESINFDAPLHCLDAQTYILELFHGPTLAFKDFGARFMARTLAYFMQEESKPLHILVATSGDTGSAVAHGFHKVPNVYVYILYPSKQVSAIQEKQFTTLGGNITALEVLGNFDDCQNLVKMALLDKELSESLLLSSANSINIARLIPQCFYYFFAIAQLLKYTKVAPYISVPSGNYGNLTAGVIARQMGLPVKGFIAASNINDVVPEYLKKGVFLSRPSVRTLSNAMDVGNPSNFVRMQTLYMDSWKKMGEDIWGASIDDGETLDTIRQVARSHKGYVIDPHGAVAVAAARLHQKQFLSNNPYICLETAHPAKFIDVVEGAVGKKIEIPKALEKCLQGKKQALLMGKAFNEFKAFLLR